jgi:WD40 repeat protein
VKGGGVLIGGREKTQALVVMTWAETETATCLSLPSFTVSADAHAEVQIVEERIERYEKVKDSHKNPDGFNSAFSQTLNNPQKHQNEAAVPVALVDGGCQTSSYEIDDTMNSGVNTEEQLVGMGDADTDDPAGLSAGVREMITDIVNVAKVSPGCLLDPDDLTRPPGPGEDKGKTKKKRDAGQSFIGGASIAGASGVNAGLAPSQQSGGATDVLPPSQTVQSPAPKMAEEAIETDGNAILFEKQSAVVLESGGLLKRLQMVERAVQQNAYHRKHLDYRDLPDVKPLTLVAEKDRNKDQGGGAGLGGFGAFGAKPPSMGGLAASSSDSQDSQSVIEEEDEDAPVKPLKTLFSYVNHDLVQGRSVTAMVWNKINQDILAVGYGKLDNFSDGAKPGEALDEQAEGGLVLFWSLRNPEYPEKVLRTPRPVTALEFSRLSPMLLAVGLQSGDVMVYDVRRDGADWGIPLESSTGMTVGQGHTEAVWQVKWVPKGNESVESLVSISSDGRVLQWNIKKGISVSCLMRLARSGKNDAWISRQASGLCFDFCPDDPSTYIVGTEEGTIHKCSVSYSEQYLENFTPHYGPVYKVKCSPRWPQVFLSCSSDWSIGLYHNQVTHRPIFNMKAAGEDFSITDVAWCPDNSTVFAAVTQSGKLQIWDLSVSCLDPVVAVDTTGDEMIKTKAKKAKKVEDEEIDPETGLPMNPSGAAVLPPQPLRRGDDHKEETKESRIQRLLRNFTEASSSNLDQNHCADMDDDASDKPAVKRRVLTCVQFSETAPAIVVGDSKGCVTVYRVIEPVVVTHMGPRQQEEKLKAAVISLDPAAADLLKATESKAD